MALDLTKRYHIFSLLAVIENMGRIQSSVQRWSLPFPFLLDVLVHGLNSKMWGLDAQQIQRKQGMSNELGSVTNYMVAQKTCKYLCSASSDWHLPEKGKINFNVSLPSWSWYSQSWQKCPWGINNLSIFSKMKKICKLQPCKSKLICLSYYCRFTVVYMSNIWLGYFSAVVALNCALNEGEVI